MNHSYLSTFESRMQNRQQKFRDQWLYLFLWVELSIRFTYENEWQIHEVTNSKILYKSCKTNSFSEKRRSHVIIFGYLVLSFFRRVPSVAFTWEISKTLYSPLNEQLALSAVFTPAVIGVILSSKGRSQGSKLNQSLAKKEKH